MTVSLAADEGFFSSFVTLFSDCKFSWRFSPPPEDVRAKGLMRGTSPEFVRSINTPDSLLAPPAPLLLKGLAMMRVLLEEVSCDMLMSARCAGGMSVS